MPPSNLFFTEEFCPLSNLQKRTLEDAGVDPEIKDQSCSRSDLNSCGESIESLLSKYEIYSAQKGLYEKWGDVDFPWEVTDSTFNLDVDQSNDVWNLATYIKIVSYEQGDRVLVIEEDGYKVSLFEANQNILTGSGGFDYSKWDRVCSVTTTVPAGLPSISTLLDQYQLYSLDGYIDTWGEVDEKWGEELSEIALNYCSSLSLTGDELDKCVSGRSSDLWSDLKVRKQNYYVTGDITLSQKSCGDTLCVWTAVQNVPNTPYIESNLSLFSPSIKHSGTISANGGEVIGDKTTFDTELIVGSKITTKDVNGNVVNLTVVGFDEESPSTLMQVTPTNITVVDQEFTSVFWQKVYCVSTGVNKCLEREVQKSPSDFYEVVEIGSRGHYVDVPEPYPKYTRKSLDEMAREKIPAKILTDEEIKSLNPPQ